MARYALYFAPPEDGPLWRFGSFWIGRDARSVAEPVPPDIPGLDAERWREVTGSPRHYGFHGTLKPPFALAEGTTLEELESSAAAFADSRPAFAAPPLVLKDVGGFLALCPAERSAALDGLAADCVRAFESFRAPQSETELDKRRKGGLPPRQEAMLQRWGYPYVMEEFRFHMTLTSRLDADERRRLGALLEPLVAPLAGAPLEVDAICLYHQPERSTPFTLLRRFPLRS
ncbi:MAG: DUF1045 domain-containing protein [Acetobacterales bacterium]